MDVIEREIDPLGRIVIPKAWRKAFGRHVILYNFGSEIRLKPKRAKRFSELPKIKVNLKSPLTDWHAVHQELLE